MNSDRDRFLVPPYAFKDELPTARGKRQPSRPDIEPDPDVQLGQVMAAVEAQRRDVATLTTEVLGGRRDLHELRDDLGELKDDLRALRRRVLKGALGAGSVVTVVQLLIEVGHRLAH